MDPAGHVLIVDPADEVGESSRFALEAHGYGATLYHSGDPVLRALTGGRPACLVVRDAPLCVDAAEFAAGARASGFAGPILILADQMTLARRARAEAAGARLLDMPLLSQDLAAAVDIAITEAAGKSATPGRDG